MNRILIRLVLLATPLSISHLVPQAQAKAAQKVAAPRTVVDYFNLLPLRYFEVEDERGAARLRVWMLSEARVKDVRNDYLVSASDGAQPSITMALFRHAGSVTVATNTSGDYGDGFDLLRLQNGRWQNVTRALVPHFSKSNFYLIPRVGTTLRVFKAGGVFGNEQGTHLYDLKWRGGRFVVS